MAAPGTPLATRLSPRAVWALTSAIDWLHDHWAEGLAQYSAIGAGGVDVDELHMAEYLPYGVRATFTPLLARKFFACLTVAGWKLCQVPALYPSCVAEELCLHAIIDQAKTQLTFREDSAPNRLPPEDPELTMTLDDLYDTAFEDTDFLEMFDPASDGLDSSPAGRELGWTSLAVEDLFKGFSSGRTQRCTHMSPSLRRRGLTPGTDVGTITPPASWGGCGGACRVAW
jgi:hypothetical protein